MSGKNWAAGLAGGFGKGLSDISGLMFKSASAKDEQLNDIFKQAIAAEVLAARDNGRPADITGVISTMKNAGFPTPSSLDKFGAELSGNGEATSAPKTSRMMPDGMPDVFPAHVPTPAAPAPGTSGGGLTGIINADMAGRNEPVPKNTTIPSQDNAALKWAKENPNDPRAIQIRKLALRRRS